MKKKKKLAKMRLARKKSVKEMLTSKGSAPDLEAEVLAAWEESQGRRREEVQRRQEEVKRRREVLQQLARWRP